MEIIKTAVICGKVNVTYLQWMCRNLVGRMQDEAIKVGGRAAGEGAHAHAIGADRDISGPHAARHEPNTHTNKTHSRIITHRFYFCRINQISCLKLY